jgi:hypothetical protein
MLSPSGATQSNFAFGITLLRRRHSKIQFKSFYRNARKGCKGNWKSKALALACFASFAVHWLA